MKELVEQIAAAYEAFAKDATAQAENGRSALVTLWDNNRIDIFMQPSNAQSC